MKSLRLTKNGTLRTLPTTRILTTSYATSAPKMNERKDKCRWGDTVGQNIFTKQRNTFDKIGGEILRRSS